MKKFTVFGLLLLSLASCADPETIFQDAEKQRTIDNYQKIVSDFPDSDFAMRAKERIKDIKSWREVEGKQEKEPYETYLKTYPNGLFSEDALFQMKAIDSYWLTQKQDLLAAYRNFDKKYPNSVFANLISQRMKELEPVDKEYDAIKDEINPEPFRNFLEKHSSSGYGRLAQERLLEILPEPNIKFVFGKFRTGKWPNEKLNNFRQIITKAIRFAGIGMPVESTQVYVHYDSQYGMGFDHNSRPYNFFKHDLKIVAKNNAGKSLYDKSYSGYVPGAHSGSTFRKSGTYGIRMGPVDYDLVLANIEKWLRDDPL